MAKITSMMDVGKRSMMNSKAALHTVGHNIANKNTEGYSRQRVELVASDPISSGNLRFGTGAKAASVTRVVNPQLEKQIGNEKSELGYLQGQNEGLVRVEQIYNEQLVDGLNSSVANFFNAFRELSNSPESMAARTLVSESASFMAKDFNKTHQSLLDVRKDLDEQISVHVNDINETTREIATLNEKIQMVEITGAFANDERDRRDLLIKNLGEKINIRWAEGKDGSVHITAGNSAILVTGREAKELAVARTPESGNKGEGNYDIMYKGEHPDNPIVMTSQFTGGNLGGLVKIRDQFIGDLLTGLDKMAYGITNEVNDVHVQGYNAYDQTQQNFFQPIGEEKQASLNMALDRKLLDDPARISIAGQPMAPGDNRIANTISDLQYKKTMNGGAATLDEFYNSVVGQVGVVTHRIQNEVETQSNIITQLTNIRESVSGVSLDEETTKMIEYQKAFDASARLIRTADEMLETVINLKR